MNDRYLYRAKRADNGEWIIGNLVYSENASIGYEYMIMPTQIIGNWSTVLKDTICQCTGLKDKNGKLIWENDIVWDSEERKFYKIIFSQEDMCYYAQDSDGYKDTFESCYGSSIDVESNIFDNPELLEVGE